MMIKDKGSFVMIIADEGKVLYNGESFGEQIMLGCIDDMGNWIDVFEDEIPKEDVEIFDSTPLDVQHVKNK